MKHKYLSIISATMIALLTLSGSIAFAQESDRPEGWDEYSHGNDTDPDYEVVFPQDEVNTITISISPENWTAIQEDMTNLFGEFGTREGRGDPGRGDFRGEPPEGFAPPDGDFPQFPDNGEPPEGFAFPDGGFPGNGEVPEGFEPPDGNFGGRGGGFPGGNLNFAEEDPIWVTADVTFGDETWTNVGFRYKGNSTLSGAWGSGSLKMGFKLNFDKFEDDYPEIDNQRFFGFDEISFSSNYRDSSYLHEKVAADLYREAGIPAAETAFYAVYVDYGEGPVYIGLYTAVEEIDDTVLDVQFEDDSGNLYKPEGTGAAFVADSFDEESFEKKTNEDEADFSDILALFDALHDETRTTDPETWRANLEAVLDVDEFIRWLATNTLIQNWDTYGAMAHNYYLYNDPTTGLLTWIPWDNNEALSGGGRQNNNGSLDLTSTNDNWPLISFLMNDPVYLALYQSDVAEIAETVFVPDDMTETYERLHALIAPYVTGEATGSPDIELGSAETFENSLDQLIQHVNERYTLAQEYLSAQS